jgi:DNA-binding response OmpR family regulator
MATVPLSSPPSSHARLWARTILIIEDEPLIALHLHATLHEAGAGLIAATTADEALKLIGRNDISAAIVDVGLGGQDCYPVCEQLSGRRIPFAFHTGHPAAEVLRRWPEAPVFIKPTPVAELVAGIAALIALTSKGAGRF